LGGHRTDPVSDDVLALLQQRAGERAFRTVHRPPVRACAPRLSACTARRAENLERDRRHGRAAVRRDYPARHDFQIGTHAGGGSSVMAGGQIFVFSLPALPGAQGAPIQVVINTTEPFQNLNEVVQAVLAKARDSGKFWFIDADLKIDKPQSTVVVDRDLISTLGLTQQDVGSALGDALGGGYVNYFSIAGRSYKVIPQVLQADRLNPNQVLDYYVRAPNGAVLPASTLASLKSETVPQSINRFQQLNSASITGASGMAQGEALKFLRDTLAEVAPSGYQTDYSGQSRQFMQESGGFATTLMFAIIIV